MLSCGAILTLAFSTAAAGARSRQMLTVSDATPTAGSNLVLAVSGFCANYNITFWLDFTTVAESFSFGQAHTDATGTASLATSAPATLGKHTVTATSDGLDCTLEATATIDVQPIDAPHGDIPGTGSERLMLLTGASVTTLLAGFGLRIIALRRRNPT